MAFLTSLDILDTGFLTVSSRQSQLASANRANSGSAFRLKGVTFDIQSTGNLDEGVTPAFYPANVKSHERRALVSVNPTMITLSVVLNSENTDATNYYGVNDTALLKPLLRLPHTQGWKAIYYPVDNAATDAGANSSNNRNKQLVYQLGETDTSEDQGDIDITLWTGTTSASSKDLTDVNYIPVRFKSCQQTQIASNRIMVTLTGVITG